MTLPGAAAAIIDPAKVRDYLLSPDHPVGHAKARFFTSLGFSTERWTDLRRALLRLAQNAEAELEPGSPFGQKYRLRGIKKDPDPPRAGPSWRRSGSSWQERPRRDS